MLQRAKEIVLKKLPFNDKPSSISPSDFEFLVFEACEEASEGTIFENKIVHTKDREFPDIVVNEIFGIEVKATKKNDWTSIGNSVLESSRKNGIKKVYILFGKLGGSPDIKYREYEACLKGIAVTHYPRYQINMDLADGESIFDLMETSYEEIRQSENPIKQIREYYGSQAKGQSLWWIDDGSDKVPELNPVIQYFSMLSLSKKNDLKAEAFIQFPAILSNSQTKFTKVAAHWISTYGIVSPNLRDNFTAKGRVKIVYDGETYEVPRIIETFIGVMQLIDQKISQSESMNLSQWKEDINRFSEDLDLPLKASSIYEAALAGQISIAQS